jgi:hypothetical protein
MNKTIIPLSIIPIVAIAMTEAQKDAFVQANIQELEKTYSAVEILHKGDYRMEGWKENEFRSCKKEIEHRGYVKKKSPRAHELIHTKDIEPKTRMAVKGTDTHLRYSAEDIPLAYRYTGVPYTEVEHYYGIVPVGPYIQENQTGWTGAMELFKSKFAHCSYTEKNMRIAHDGAQIAEDEAGNDVNGKVTLIDVEGNESTGYLYRVNWFDNTFNRNLECASNKFSKQLIQETIDLAKVIDNYQG